MSNPVINSLPLAISLIALIEEIVADNCDNGTRCPAHKYCCSSGCCYDDHDDSRYNYGYRLSIWNMWYFWFIILFVLMSCFSGCGYYKQRQRMLRSQHSGNNGFGFFSVFQTQGPNRSYRHDVSELASHNTDIQRQSQQTNNPTGFWSFFQVPSRSRHGNTGVVTIETGYRGQVDHEGATLQPPPYSEVVNNPELFPPNTKVDLPPYNQEPVVSPLTSSGTQSGETTVPVNPPQPPPYSEVANQNTAEMFTANQVSQNPTNQ